VLDLWRNVYRDGPIGLMSERVERGPFAGLWTTPSHRALAEGMARDIARLRGRSQSVLFYDYFPAGYLMSDLRPRTPALWMFSSSRRWWGNEEIRDIYARSFEDPEQLPDLVVRMRVVPLVQEHEMRVPRNDPVRERLVAGRYETVAVRDHYTIERKPSAASPDGEERAGGELEARDAGRAQRSGSGQ